ncbi:MAG TPA: hypothetical protein VKW78_13750 [Terriglobales bacterium]|nr:hypothetical protein [Terriglobales bacterium]
MSLLSGWVQQGVESFIATQRILVDLAIRQNANAMNVIRERLADPDICPAAIISELAGEGVTNFIEAQRILLSLVQSENEILMKGVKERVGITKTTAAMSDMVRRSIDNFLDMQHGFLKIASKHTQHWLMGAKAGKNADGVRLVDIAQEGMENFVRSQKKFLDILAEETVHATSRERGTERKTKKTELSQLALEATDSFIDAQKKLLDVAGKQVTAGVKAAGRTAKMFKPLPFEPLADITRKGVKGFVDAEKAMIDSMVKGGRKIETRPPRRVKARVTRKTRAPRVAAAVA